MTLIGAEVSVVRDHSSAWTYIISAAGVLFGLIGSYLGYRGQKRNADAEGENIVIQGAHGLIQDLQAEVKRCQDGHADRDQRIEELEKRQDELEQRNDDLVRRNDQLSNELHNVLNDFSALQRVVRDEIAASAAAMSIKSARSVLDEKDDPGPRGG